MNVDIKSGVKNGYLWIGIRLDHAHRANVALEPCTCVQSKSSATAAIRKDLKQAIVDAEAGHG